MHCETYYVIFLAKKLIFFFEETQNCHIWYCLKKLLNLFWLWQRKFLFSVLNFFLFIKFTKQNFVAFSKCMNFIFSIFFVFRFLKKWNKNQICMTNWKYNSLHRGTMAWCQCSNNNGQVFVQGYLIYDAPLPNHHS